MKMRCLIFAGLMLLSGVHSHVNLNAMEAQGLPEGFAEFDRQLQDLFAFLLNQPILGGGLNINNGSRVRIVQIRDCEDPNLTMPVAHDQNRCFSCKRLYDDAERIAVLPCGDTLCCSCANIKLSLFHKCPRCEREANGYRSKAFFFTIKKFRSDQLEMPVIRKEKQCAICCEDFEDCSEIAVLPCGHSFCCACIDHALTIKEECPLCRREAHNYRASKFFK